MRVGSKYKATFAGQALKDGKVIQGANDEETKTVASPGPNEGMLKLLKNSLALAKDDQLDGIAVIVITKEGEMQMAYHAKNAALLHLHAGRLMHEVEHDIFVKKQQEKRTLL